MYRDDLNTVIANVSGLPAMSVPAEMFFKNRHTNPLEQKEIFEDCISEKTVSKTNNKTVFYRDGVTVTDGNGDTLPLGIQFMGRRGEDDRFFDIVLAF